MIRVGQIEIGSGRPIIIAGPCAVESREVVFETAEIVKKLTAEYNFQLIFKSSYRKANRLSGKSFSSIGTHEALRILAEVRAVLEIPVLTDVHAVDEIRTAVEVADILQIPAFLCRQTDFIIAVSEAGKPINIKKGQFLAPWDVQHIIEKVVSTGNRQVFVTERGTTFGYNNLVVDFRGLAMMRDLGWPVVFDATHSVQLPGGAGKASGGQRQFVPMMARAAAAAGVDGIFIEAYEDPDRAPCDGPNALPLRGVGPLLEQLKAIRGALSLS